MPIRVQIVEGRGLISKAIGFETRSWATHAEFIDTDRGVTLGARAKGGVRIRTFHPEDYRRVEHFVANHEIAEQQIMREAWDWAARRQGAPYDFSAITGMALGRDFHDPKKWFCSELVYCAFEATGYPLLSTRPSAKPWRITPRDLLLSRELVYIPPEER